MKSAFFLLLILAAITAKGQSVLYTPAEKFDLRTGDYSVVGKIGDRLFTYRAANDGYYLDAFNDSMERTATVVLDFFPQKIRETRFIAYRDKIIVLYQSSERSAVTQYAAVLDGKGRLLGNPITIDQQKTGFFGAAGDYFFSAVSEDKRRIVVYSAAAKGAQLHIEHTLLNDSLRPMQHSETTYTGAASLSAEPGMVSNDGDFYLPVTTVNGSRDYADGIWLLTLPYSSQRLIETELPLAGTFGSGMYFKTDNASRRIYAGGFFSAKKSGNYDGILIAQFNMDSLSQVATKRIALDERIRTESGGRSARRAFNDYKTRQLIVRADGGFVLLAEEYYTTMRTGGAFSPNGGYYTPFYSPYAGAQNIREYHYGDILALSYDAAGMREWSAFLRKEQFSQDDAGAFSSYAFINTGGALGFLYNDFDSRRSRITLATMDETGHTSTHAIDAGGPQDPDWLPRAGKQVSAHELVVPCLKRRALCFAKVVF